MLTLVSLVLAGATPDLIVLDPARLDDCAARIAANDPEVMPAYNALIQKANAALTGPVYTVTADDLIPPSGDIHDFTSYSPYYWPNPDTKDGFPWIYIDGHNNPDNQHDPYAILFWSIDVLRLGLAYHYTGNEQYADRAAVLVRAWFLDPETYMTPRCDHANVRPGLDEGSMGIIIPGRAWLRVMDGIGLIRTSPSWTADDEDGVHAWGAQYLAWLQSDDDALFQESRPNNHGTYFDMHEVGWTFFLGDEAGAAALLEEVKTRRLDPQIDADGTMPFEIDRANSLSYHDIVLRGFFRLAQMGDKVGVDLWTYEGADGGSLAVSLEYCAPYATSMLEWPHFPGEPFPVTGNHWHDVYHIAGAHMDCEWSSVAGDVLGDFDDRDVHVEQNTYDDCPCPWDLDGDGEVGFSDLTAELLMDDFVGLTALLAAWGPC